MDVSRDGRFLVSGGEDRSVAIFDLVKRVHLSSFQNLDKGKLL